MEILRHFHPEAADDAEAELFSRVDRRIAEGVELTSQIVRRLSASEGCDFATAYLHRWIVRSDRHREFLESLASSEPGFPVEKPTIAIVPGAFYQENPRTGADGRVVRKAANDLGMVTTMVPVSSTGTLQQNARSLMDCLGEHQNEKLLLVSISKGGSDIKAALARDDASECFRNVVGWINLCGILDGTPMADWLLSPALLARVNRFVYRIRGRSLSFLGDLQRFPGCPLDFPLNLTPDLPTVHVVGFPLRRHLRNGLARRCHQRLADWGPNDGSILLADALEWSGQLCPVWGADHYLRPQLDVVPLLRSLIVRMAARSVPSF